MMSDTGTWPGPCPIAHEGEALSVLVPPMPCGDPFVSMWDALLRVKRCSRATYVRLHAFYDVHNTVAEAVAAGVITEGEVTKMMGAAVGLIYRAGDEHAGWRSVLNLIHERHPDGFPVLLTPDPPKSYVPQNHD